MRPILPRHLQLSPLPPTGRMAPGLPSGARHGPTLAPARGDAGEILARSEIPGGPTVVSAEMPGARSVAIAITLPVGSVDDPAPLAGLAHLLEHMVFKGTTRRSARDISLEIERRGGMLNAYTAPLLTQFVAHVRRADVPVAFDVLADVVFAPLLREEDFQLERQVVLEEVAMRKDSVATLAMERMQRALFGRHPYGRPVIGDVRTVSRATVEDVGALHARAYVPEGAIIASAGALTHWELLGLVATADWARSADTGPGGGRARRIPVRRAPTAPPALTTEHVRRRGEQLQVLLGSPALALGDPREPALAILHGALGGGASARLFHEIRETRGLAYTVESWLEAYPGAGIHGVALGTSPAQRDQALDAVRALLADVSTAGFRPEEVADARTQREGELELGLEHPVSRLDDLVTREASGLPLLTVAEQVADVASVTADAVNALAAELCQPARQSVVTFGPQPPSQGQTT